jgi:Zn2+/Cd2+-exporting ATPase
MTNSTPFLFDEFFASGKEETVSPFLTPTSRKWGKNLQMKSALFSALLLLFAYVSAPFYPLSTALLLIPVYILSGTPALIDAIEDLKNLEINIDILMTLAAFLAITIGSAKEGALLLVLFELSAAMENNVSQKTKSALIHLNQIAPKMAVVLDKDGTLFERSVKEIELGTSLLIKAGEIVPLDGIVTSGSSSVNLVHLTGEGHPVNKKIEDEVPAGARNLEGTLTIKVTRTSSDSTLSRIVTLITQAQEAKPKLEKLFDRFGKVYAMTIICLSLLFALTLPLLFSIPYLGTEGGIYRALTFLIAASPCALIIATPTAYLSAISSCAKRGILLKGGVILDALASCKKIAFDKTGTLTTGKLNCYAIESISPDALHTPKMALAIASSLERYTVHPLAEAILTRAREEQISPLAVDNFKSIPGLGVEGMVTLDGKTLSVALGNNEFIASKGMIPPLEKETLLLIDKSLFVFRFTDALRPAIKKVIRDLKEELRFAVVMLTGDHFKSAQEVAKEVGIEEIFADLRPEDKLEKVGAFSQEEGLIMIGDGINDAPALARATVGISLGKIGSATAVDASDVVFLNDDLTLLCWLIGKARKTRSIVKQNISLALMVILFATTPALLGLVPLWVAVVLHEGGTVLVGLNSLRLLSRKSA